MIAVKSEEAGGEDEIKACIVRAPGSVLEAADVWAWCDERLPHFAVPRYVEFLDALPKTPTEKVRKNLSARGRRIDSGRGHGRTARPRRPASARRSRRSADRLTQVPTRCRDVVEALRAHERERAVDVGAQHLEHPCDPRLAAGGEGEEPRPADETRPGAERTCLDRVLAPADAPVDETSARSPTASTTSGSTSNVAGDESSWRPPWFET